MKYTALSTREAQCFQEASQIYHTGAPNARVIVHGIVIVRVEIIRAERGEIANSAEEEEKKRTREVRFLYSPLYGHLVLN